MKYVGLLISSVVVFLVILTNFYYNSITLDMQKIKELDLFKSTCPKMIQCATEIVEQMLACC